MKSYETLFNAQAITRKIDSIVVHCAAIQSASPVTTEDIAQWHIQERHFRDIGYHFVVDQKGIIHKGRPLEEMGAHAAGHNAHSIGICYLGGLDSHGQPADTRTPLQQLAIKQLIGLLVNEFNIYDVLGHRDLSPDVNGDGQITRVDWIKMCPCYDAHAEWLSYLREMAMVSRNYVYAQKQLQEPVTDALLKLCESAEEYLKVEDEEGGLGAIEPSVQGLDPQEPSSLECPDRPPLEALQEEVPIGLLLEDDPPDGNPPVPPPPAGMYMVGGRKRWWWFS